MVNNVDSSTDTNHSYPIGIGFVGHMNDSAASVADVKKGRLIRIRPLHYDWKYDKNTFNPWKLEVRGKSLEPFMKSLVPPYSLAYKKRVYSPNRILFPLKRVDWNPDGNRNPQNRGKSKYVRISWDEAIDIICKEIKRMYREYGPYAILSQSDGHGEVKTVHGPHGCSRKLLKLLGGYTLQTRNPDSWEGWYWGAKHVWGMEPLGQMDGAGYGENVALEVAKHAQMLLFWGCDPETTPWGFNGQMASRLCYWFSDLGIKSIYVCPDLNYGAAVHADKWIPILPNTDAALQLAIAYTWITETTFDKEYIKTHTYGFDKFADYVLGKEDNTPKTPAWASPKTGISEWTIKALAREWAKKITTITHGNGGPGLRGVYSTETGRLEVLLLALQGLGKPGVHQMKMIEWGIFERHINHPLPGGKVVPTVIGAYTGGLYSRDADALKQIIPKNLIHEALLNPPISWYGTTLLDAPVENQYKKYTYPAEGCPEIHMIWTDTPCWITCWNDTNSYIKGLRSKKVEFILAEHQWMENDCLFADLVLPVNTKFEEEDITHDSAGGQFYVLLRQKKCVEPIGESKSDFEISCMIAEKLGILKEYTDGNSIADYIRKGYETAVSDKNISLANASGTSDSREESSVREAMISYEELEEKGYAVTPTNPDWQKLKPAISRFYDDPEKNPLTTPTGKLEFYATGLAKNFPDDIERAPVPRWIEKGEYHDERLSSERAKKYPLAMVSNHGRWRVHAQCDDISWTRECPTGKVRGYDGYQYEPLWVNPKDAASRDLRSGDIVMIKNERGTVLGGAFVTERIMPGVVYMDHGARYDPIIPGELDRGGAINTITPHKIISKNVTGMVCSGFLVEVEKVSMAQMEEWKQKYPVAFGKRYDLAAGLRFDAMVV